MTVEATRTVVGEPELVIVPDLETLASEAAQRIATALASDVAARGRSDWVTTGGTAAAPIYGRLAAQPLRDVVPWSAVHVWWGDDRYVPRDHPHSNVKPFDDILLAIGYAEEGQVGKGGGGAPVPVRLPIGHLHPFPTGEAIGGARGAEWCAAQLAAELKEAGPPMSGNWPTFDLIVVGVGADGHLLSVFPGSPALDSGELALAIAAPTHIEPHVERVTLNPHVLRVARRVLAVVSGADKAPVVADILESARDSSRWPAELARREGATWIVDEAAAARLHR